MTRSDDDVAGTAVILIHDSRPEPSGNAASPFVRGDANDDGEVDIADPVFILNQLFLGGPPANCETATDANDDGLRDLSDAIYLLGHQFLGGSSPPAPFPACGLDATADGLNCVSTTLSSTPGKGEDHDCVYQHAPSFKPR